MSHIKLKILLAIIASAIGFFSIGMVTIYACDNNCLISSYLIDIYRGAFSAASISLLLITPVKKSIYFFIFIFMAMLLVFSEIHAFLLVSETAVFDSSDWYVSLFKRILGIMSGFLIIVVLARLLEEYPDNNMFWVSATTYAFTIFALLYSIYFIIGLPVYNRIVLFIIVILISYGSKKGHP